MQIKTFDKIQHLFMIYLFSKLEIERNCFNLIKPPPTNIILHGEKPKVFPLRSIMRQGCLFSPLLFCMY